MGAGYGGANGYAGYYGYAPYVRRVTETAFEALNEYGGRRYHVIGRGSYIGGTLIQAAPWAYAETDLHVAKTGNDTTGDGSFALPYLTIHKAVSVVAAGGGLTIWVREGAYTENSGSGLLAFSAKSYTDPLVIRGVPGDDVVLTNASGAIALRFLGACAKIIFDSITITPNGVGTCVVISSGANSLSGGEFRDCRFIDSGSNNAFAFSVSTAGSCPDLAVKRCTFSSGGRFTAYFNPCPRLRLIGNTHTSTATDERAFRIEQISGACHVNENVVSRINATTGNAIDFPSALTAPTTIACKRNRVTTGGTGIVFEGGTSGNPITITCDDNEATTGGSGIAAKGWTTGDSCQRNTVIAGGNVGIGWPTDAGGGKVLQANIRHNHSVCSGALGHPLLISSNAEGCTFDDNIADGRPGGRYGIVLKGINNNGVDNTIYGGTQNGLYLKEAIGCNVSGGRIVQSIAGGAAIDFAAQDAQNTEDCACTNIDIEVTNGRLYNFAGAAIGTGNVVDENRITVSGSGLWGSMFGGAVASLAAVRASWAANYDVTTNDASSVEV